MPKINVVNADNVIEYNPQKAFFKLKNTGGPKGDKGDTGPQGPQGIQGPQGPQGPEGKQGPKGEDGAPGQGINVQGTVATYADLPADLGPSDAGEAYLVSADGKLYIWSGTSWPAEGQGAQFEGPQGPQGETGPAGQDGADGQPGQAATIAVGTTTTLPAGQSATVTNSGTSSAAVFDFGIPKGADADPAVTQKSTTTPAYITDAGYAIKSLDKLEGNTSQDGTPTPDAPVPVKTVTGENVVKICGKNLLDPSNGWTNQAISVEGVIGPNNNTALSGYISVVAGQSYTFSQVQLTSTPYKPNIVSFFNSAKAFIGRTQVLNLDPQTFTAPANCAFIRFGYYNANGLDASNLWNLISNAQLELGSTATAYEPYQGQDYEINLGKNLFDKDNASGLLEGYISGGKAWTASGFWSYYIPCQPNTTYTASRTIIGNGGRFTIATSQAVPANNVAVEQLTQDNTATSLTITTGSSAKYIIVWFANVNDAGSESLADWEAVQQIEKGSQATSYAPYFTPIELCKIGDYQDYIYPSGGKWYVHKAVGKHLFDGSETFTSDGSYNSIYQYKWTDSSVFNTSDQTGIYAVSDKFAGTFYNSSWTKDFTVIVRTTHNALRFMTSLSSTISAFQTWLETNQTTVYYPLATPTDTEITNVALLAQLEAVNNAALCNGISNVVITPAEGNEQAGMDFTYWTWYKGEPGPTPNNGTLTIQKNGVDVQTFSADQSSNVTANITVPTSVSELSDASNYALQAQLSRWFNMGTVKLPEYGTKLFCNMSNNDFTRFKLLIVGSLADNVSGAWVNITPYTGTPDSYTAQNTDGMLITLDSNGVTATPWSSAATAFSMTGLATANSFSAECLFAQNLAGDPVKFEIKAGVHQKGVLMSTGIIPGGVKPNGFLLESNGNITAGTSITLWCYAD